tara:strand:+ start:1743 stop:2003 length:261 start_codon:yes stop_codon:yes gene_type:complete
MEYVDCKEGDLIKAKLTWDEAWSRGEYNVPTGGTFKPFWAIVLQKVTTKYAPEPFCLYEVIPIDGRRECKSVFVHSPSNIILEKHS